MYNFILFLLITAAIISYCKQYTPLPVRPHTRRNTIRTIRGTLLNR